MHPLRQTHESTFHEIEGGRSIIVVSAMELFKTAFRSQIEMESGVQLHVTVSSGVLRLGSHLATQQLVTSLA